MLVFIMVYLLYSDFQEVCHYLGWITQVTAIIKYKIIIVNLNLDMKMSVISMMKITLYPKNSTQDYEGFCP